MQGTGYNSVGRAEGTKGKSDQEPIASSCLCYWRRRCSPLWLHRPGFALAEVQGPPHPTGTVRVRTWALVPLLLVSHQSTGGAQLLGACGKHILPASFLSSAELSSAERRS